MTHASTTAATSVLRLRVRLRDSGTNPSLAEFADQFRRLESLLFVGALLSATDSETQSDPLRPERIFPESSVREGQLYSGEVIAAATAIAASFQVHAVTYQSPLEVVLTVVEQLGEAGPYVFIPAWASLTAHQAILLWRSFSGGRLRQLEVDLAQLRVDEATVDLEHRDRVAAAIADTAEAKARIANAEARIKEAEAAVKEAQAAAKVEAANIIRSRLGVAGTIHASTSMSNRSGPVEQATTPQAVTKRLEEATEALVSIDGMWRWRIDVLTPIGVAFAPGRETADFGLARALNPAPLLVLGDRNHGLL